MVPQTHEKVVEAKAEPSLWTNVQQRGDQPYNDETVIVVMICQTISGQWSHRLRGRYTSIKSANAILLIHHHNSFRDGGVNLWSTVSTLHG